MTNLTSIADFYARVKCDERYKLIARVAHKESGHSGAKLGNTYEDAVKWIDAWIVTRRQDLRHMGRRDGCYEMVDYLNEVMNKMPLFTSKLISPHTVNNFSNVSALTIT